jgi:hypothetical protein
VNKTIKRTGTGQSRIASCAGDNFRSGRRKRRGNPDIAQQEGKRMKKEYLKQAIRLKRKKEFAPGYTRRAGWIIYYGLKKLPELILTADEKWTEQLYMLQSDDKGAYRAGERPWLMKPNDDMSLHLAVNDLIEVGFNMITFIVLSCHVWDEEVDDRNVRRMSKKVMKMMTDSSDYVVQPTSPFFKLATGEFEEGDKKRIKEAAIAKQREKDLAEVLQKLKKIRLSIMLYKEMILILVF